MPLSKEARARYPSDWKQIRERILVRAGNACEGTWQHPNCRAANGEPHPQTGSRVVLTIGHLNPPIEDCRDENLRAWCNRCHLAYDHRQHIENARRTRERHKGLMRLPGCEAL